MTHRQTFIFTRIFFFFFDEQRVTKKSIKLSEISRLPQQHWGENNRGEIKKENEGSFNLKTFPLFETTKVGFAFPPDQTVGNGHFGFVVELVLDPPIFPRPRIYIYFFFRPFREKERDRG